MAAGVFAATATWLFTVSAVYHVGAWSPRARVILRRADHADILFLIAGTYTPLAVLALGGDTRIAILTVVWAGAALSAVFNTAWTGAPRWVYVPVYLGVGWVAVLALPQLLRGAGLTALVLIVVGGVLYSLGGIAYGLQAPGPVATVVRISRGLPRLHRRGIRLPVHRRLDCGPPRRVTPVGGDRGDVGAVLATAPIAVDPVTDGSQTGSRRPGSSPGA